MKRLFLTLCALMLGSLLAACTPRTPVSDALAKQLGSAQQIDLAKLTAFEWDTVLVFSPYTAQKDICSSPGLTWADCTKHTPDYLPETAFFMVYLVKGNAVHHELHPRRNGEFCLQTCALRFTREQAVFSVGPHPSNSAGFQAFLLTPVSNKSK